MEVAAGHMKIFDTIVDFLRAEGFPIDENTTENSYNTDDESGIGLIIFNYGPEVVPWENNFQIHLVVNGTELELVKFDGTATLGGPIQVQTTTKFDLNQPDCMDRLITTIKAMEKRQ